MLTSQRVRWRCTKKIESLSASFACTNILYSDELRAGTRTDLCHKCPPRAIARCHRSRLVMKVCIYDLALCPFTGKGFAAFLPKLNGPFFSWFIAQINGKLSKTTLFVANGARAHKAEYLKDTYISKLPPACPELNPVERVFWLRIPGLTLL